MFQRWTLSTLLAAAVMYVSGCCCTQPFVCGTGPGCHGCGAAACDSCEGAVQGCHHLFPWHGGCGAGCGDVYWGEWTSDPPACCDPCDNCGNWAGHGSCFPWLPWDGLFHLWGYRYGGCDTCGSFETPVEAMLPMDGEIIEGPVDGQPSPAEEQPKLKPPVPEPEPDQAAQAPAKRTARQTKHVTASARYTVNRKTH